MKMQHVVIMNFLVTLWIVGCDVAEEKEIRHSDTLLLPACTSVDATLLHDVIFAIKAGEKNSIKPMLFKIDNLPTHLNQHIPNIKGCFVTAEGTINSVTGRIHGRFNTLSCVTPDGKEVINQQVAGFVVDKNDRISGLAAKELENYDTNAPVFTLTSQMQVELVFPQGIILGFMISNNIEGSQPELRYCGSTTNYLQFNKN